jgi:hypothetical protein
MHTYIHKATTASTRLAQIDYGEGVCLTRIEFLARAGTAPASQNLWSFSTSSSEWTNHGTLLGSPPSVAHCSMTSMGNTSIWLFGGLMTETNEIHSGLYRLSLAGQQPTWDQMQLRKAPLGRFGASLHAIGNNIYLYGGFGSRSAGSQNNDLVVLATYDDPGLIPVWVRTFNLSVAPQNRLHFASAAVGRGVWVHGGYHVRDQQINVNAEHELWYLNTYLDGPAKGKPCPKGYSRDPESADPCVDVGE